MIDVTLCVFILLLVSMLTLAVVRDARRRARRRLWKTSDASEKGLQ